MTPPADARAFVDAFYVAFAANDHAALERLGKTDVALLKGWPHQVQWAHAVHDRLVRGQWDGEIMIGALELTDPDRLPEPLIDEVLMGDVQEMALVMKIAEGDLEGANLAFKKAVELGDRIPVRAAAEAVRGRLRVLRAFAAARGLPLDNDARLEVAVPNPAEARDGQLAGLQRLEARALVTQFGFLRVSLQPPPSLPGWAVAWLLAGLGAALLPWTWARLVSGLVLIAAVATYFVLRSGTAAALRKGTEAEATLLQAEAFCERIQAALQRPEGARPDPELQDLIEGLDAAMKTRLH